MAQNLFMPITSSNTVSLMEFVVTLTLKVPPNLIGVVTLPCKMSDIALKPAMTITNCMINVD